MYICMCEKRNEDAARGAEEIRGKNEKLSQRRNQFSSGPSSPFDARARVYICIRRKERDRLFMWDTFVGAVARFTRALYARERESIRP